MPTELSSNNSVPQRDLQVSIFIQRNGIIEVLTVPLVDNNSEADVKGVRETFNLRPSLVLQFR